MIKGAPQEHVVAKEELDDHRMDGYMNTSV